MTNDSNHKQMITSSFAMFQLFVCIDYVICFDNVCHANFTPVNESLERLQF